MLPACWTPPGPGLVLLLCWDRRRRRPRVSPGGPGLPVRPTQVLTRAITPCVTCSPAPIGPPGRSYSSGLACCPVVPLGFWVEEERDDAVNEDAVSSYRKQAGRYAEAAGYEACLADVVGRAIGQHAGERC